MAYLLQNKGRTVVNTEADNILVKQLAFENANKACKTALWLFRKRVLCRK
jgi:hypothetical protein